MATRSGDAGKKKSGAQQLRAKKIQACLEQISRDEAMAALLTKEQAALVGENVVGLSVAHKQFGSGQISAQDALTVCVQFPGGVRRFPIPHAFLEGFLKTEDGTMQGRIVRYRELEGQIAERKKEIVSADHTIQRLKSKT